VINIKKIFCITAILSLLLTNGKTEIKDSLFATVGPVAITRSDVINEIKIILILNGKIFTEDQQDILQTSAAKSLIKRAIKNIEIKKYDGLEFSRKDISDRLKKLAENIYMDVDSLKDVFAANEIEFSHITDQIKTELLWNSLIFDMYKNRITINESEIEEQLKLLENKEENIKEYLISEILIAPVPVNELDSKVNEINKRIEIEGFEKVAIDISISETSKKGGDLGWVEENSISSVFKTKIANTIIGNISEPTVLPQGVLFFKVRDKRNSKKSKNLKEIKKQLEDAEKLKILNMYSLSHFDKIRRSITINYF